MEFFLSVILFTFAIFFIIKGGDLLVDSSIWFAKVTRIPPMIIGATVVSIATTLPEVLVSTFAVLRGMPAYGIAVGNATGSMICNIGIIIGLAALISPSNVEKRSFGEKAVILGFCTILLAIFCFTGKAISLVEGVVLLLLFVGFIIFNILDAKRNRTKITLEKIPDKKEKAVFKILFFILGAGLIAVGANLLVDNGMFIAGYIGISSELMGLTFVAIGTSLPELVTTITSIKRKSAALGIGNILGANIINNTLLVGLCGVIAGGSGGLTMSASTMWITLPALIIITGMLIIPTMIMKRTSKWQGVMILSTYAIYITIMILLQIGII